jgi:hypothetical protein
LFPAEGFELSFRSPRGIAYLGLIVLMAILLLGLGILTIFVLGKGSPLRTWEYFNLATFAFLGFAIWQTLHVFSRVAIKRIVECPMMLLATDELYGQIRFIRRRDTKLPTGWISLVRISSQCPICAGSIDAPSEHVFSFDPTSHLGALIQSGVRK